MVLVAGTMAGNLGSLSARAWPLRQRLVHKARSASLGLIPLLRPCRGGQRGWCSAVIPPRHAGRAALWLIVGAALCALTGVANAASRPNVLLIVIDDLNDWVGHLGGHPQAKTPNIDALASRGVRFTNAYTASPECNPSRAALFSGKRPSTSGIYNNTVDWRPHLPPALMLPTQFRKAGYLVAGSGKIYHHNKERPTDWDRYSPYSVTQASPKCATNPVTAADGRIRYAIGACADSDTSDYKNVQWMIDRLKENHSQPFFFALGSWLPHLYWYAPKKYYDLYPRTTVQLPPYRSTDLDDVPAPGKSMARKDSDHDAIVAAGTQHWRDLVRAYLASISYADAQVGRVIAALNASPYRDNTIVVLLSDHGWHLGEKRHWQKYTLWEEATRVPYVWIVPGVTGVNQTVAAPVDLMSLYPTLMELSGLPIPTHVEGTSVRPLLANPAASRNVPAVMTYQYRNHAVRSGPWRYIRYSNGNEELYNRSSDPNEWTNLAGRADMAQRKAELARLLPAVNAPPATN
jgi:arylsulfatase A-like enzyme